MQGAFPGFARWLHWEYPRAILPGSPRSELVLPPMLPCNEPSPKLWASYHRADPAGAASVQGRPRRLVRGRWLHWRKRSETLRAVAHLGAFLPPLGLLCVWGRLTCFPPFCGHPACTLLAADDWGKDEIARVPAAVYMGYCVLRGPGHAIYVALVRPPCSRHRPCLTCWQCGKPSRCRGPLRLISPSCRWLAAGVRGCCGGAHHVLPDEFASALWEIGG